jgi:hypothetical protein
MSPFPVELRVLAIHKGYDVSRSTELDGFVLKTRDRELVRNDESGTHEFTLRQAMKFLRTLPEAD